MRTFIIKSLLTSLYQREEMHPSLAKRGKGRFFNNDATYTLFSNLVKNPAAETAGRPLFECLFFVSFPQAKLCRVASATRRGENPSGKIPDKSRNDRKLELRQRPQGVIIIK
ncbi:MAG: hypothetical protein A2Y97_08760 [Nitrospirae bacterium RBG_13_39_12]|nr:MAG: hypothetical protein A2Y97_08760 [Nitrospirae bacterium RBG_13_39_12]